MNTSIFCFSYLLLELFSSIFVDLVVMIFDTCVYCCRLQIRGREELTCPESEAWETQPGLQSAPAA